MECVSIFDSRRRLPVPLEAGRHGILQEEELVPFADINGINLYYEIQGFGDPVLLLHHGFGCTKMWDKLVPRLVEQGYKTICYDRRGFGQSEQGEGFDEFYVSDEFRQRKRA